MNFSFEESDKQIRSIWKLETGRGKRNMTLGWLGAAMKQANEWQKHGYKDEAAYRDAAGIGTSVWGRYVRIAKEFLHIPIEDFIRMSAENAEALSTLPFECRNDFSWMVGAITKKAEDFKRDVLQYKASSAGIEPKNMRVKFSVPCFDAQKTVIKEGIKQFSKEHGIKDEGTALEWLVMEYSGRKTFAKFVQEQLPKLRHGRWNGDPQEVLAEHIGALSEMMGNLKG